MLDSAFDLPSTVIIDTPLSSFARMLAEAEATGSKLDKQEIVKRYLAHPIHGESIGALLNLALSPYVTFGVKKLPASAGIAAIAPEAPETLRVSYYGIGLKLLDKLATRSLTGGEASQALALFFDALPNDYPAPVSERTAFQRILLKDLRAGFSDSTVNKVKPGTVPVFECQLAASEMPNIDTLEYPVLSEPKYDGVRVIAVKKNGSITLLSRNGLPFENFEEVETFLLANMPDNYVFDGEVLHRELLGEEGYKKVMKRAKAERGKNVKGNEVRYQVFDGMPLADWEAQKFGLTQMQRKYTVEALIDAMLNPDGLIGITPGRLCDSPLVLQDYYSELVAHGFEGVIIKKPAATYQFKRSKTWQKLKPFDTHDLEVCGMIEGTGKYAGSLGALTCRGEIGGKIVETEVGSGFTDAVRADIWSKGDALKGAIVEVRYQDITQAEGANSFSLRFPTFVRFRASDNAGKV